MIFGVLMCVTNWSPSTRVRIK